MAWLDDPLETIRIWMLEAACGSGASRMDRTDSSERHNERIGNISDIFAKYYASDIQLSPFQAQTIGSAILSRQPGCRLLVFGLGHDTDLWLSLNAAGETLFLETSAGWLATARDRHPDLRALTMPTFGLTVSASLVLPADQVAAFPMIAPLIGSQWDVILVDAPPGHVATDPGRAVAICWAARLASPATHVFVDDYERPLERKFVDLFLGEPRANAATVIPASRKLAQRKLYWSIGAPL